MQLAVRTVLSFAGIVAGLTTSLFAQAPCNTWVMLPAAPIQQNPIAGLAYDPLTQDLYQASEDGNGGHEGTQPWVGRRSGNSWVTILDPATFGSGSPKGLEMLDVGAGPSLYVFGGWTPLAGQTNVLRWNGASWINLPSVPVGPSALTVFDDGTGPALYAAAYNAVYRLTGGSWVSIGSAMPLGSMGVQDLCVHDDGTGPALYAAGRFSMIGGLSIADIARWNGVTWSALGAGVAGQPTALNTLGIKKLLSVREEAGPRLYAAGSFLMMDGQPANSIARFDGTSWTGVGTGIGQTLYNVDAIASFDDGTGKGSALFAMGLIAVLPSTPSFFKRFDGTTWSDALVPATGQYPTWYGTMLVADLPETSGPDLLATIFGNGPSGPLRSNARFEACGQTGRLYCMGDGSSAACPCGNNSAPAAQAGCVHSLGGAGALRASGHASLANETLRLEGSGMHDGPVIYYQGTQPNLIPFGDGFICATGAIVRLRILFNAAGASIDPEPGGPTLSTQGFITSPGTRYYSARYRDGDLAYCSSGTFNYTNAVAIVWN